jgi:hypothetical protein
VVAAVHPFAWAVHVEDPRRPCRRGPNPALSTIYSGSRHDASPARATDCAAAGPGLAPPTTGPRPLVTAVLSDRPERPPPPRMSVRTALSRPPGGRQRQSRRQQDVLRLIQKSWILRLGDRYRLRRSLRDACKGRPVRSSRSAALLRLLHPSERERGGLAARRDRATSKRLHRVLPRERGSDARGATGDGAIAWRRAYGRRATRPGPPTTSAAG